MGHGLGDYESWIGQRRVARARQRLQSLDNGSRASDNKSQANDDKLCAGDDGLRAGAYVYARMHMYASKVYKGGEVSFRHTALFLLFWLLNMSG